MDEFIVTECGIRQLHARIGDAIWRKDADAFADCYAETGEWKIAGMQISGRGEIAPKFAMLLGACERVNLICGMPLVHRDGEGYASRTQCTELAKMMDGTGAITWGVYFDRYAFEGGRWLFLRRHWAMYYRGPFDLPAEFTDCPDYGPPPGMPSADEPTFSRRFKV